MHKNLKIAALFFLLSLAAKDLKAQYFVMTATISGNNIIVSLKPVNGTQTVSWTDIEFFLRNSTAYQTADFGTATITVNTTDFPGVSIPFNGINQQGSEVGYNNYWFGLSFSASTSKTYTNNTPYTLCTIAMSSAPSGFSFEMVHNEPNFSPDYIALTDNTGSDKSNTTGTNKFYGTGATICDPNCPASTPGTNHILPLNGTLPVELIDFRAEKTGDHEALLTWHTAAEENFSNFEIERSDAQSAWTTLGAQPPRGSHSSYSFRDPEAPNGTVYYRLKMNDVDGHSGYAPIRTLRFGSPVTMSLFPNPATDWVELQFSQAPDRDDPISIELFDAAGRLVLSRYETTDADGTLRLQLAAYHLFSGVYSLRATTKAGNIYRESLIKM